MSKIQPEDLILINRDGVDYQAKVEDLPDSGGDTGSGVDPNEYARLDGAEFTGKAAFKGGIQNSGGEIFSVGDINFGDTWSLEAAYGKITSGSNFINMHNGAIDFGRFKVEPNGHVKALKFIGDGSGLINLPTGDGGNLDEYARLDGAKFTGTTAVQNGTENTVFAVGTWFDNNSYDLDTQNYLLESQSERGTLLGMNCFGSKHIAQDYVSGRPGYPLKSFFAGDPYRTPQGLWHNNEFNPGFRVFTGGNVSSRGFDCFVLQGKNSDAYPKDDEWSNVHHFLSLKWGDDLNGGGNIQPFKDTTIVQWSHLGNLRLGEGLNGGSPTVNVEILREGTIKATEFVGDGSKLTGVGLPDFRTLTALS